MSFIVNEALFDRLKRAVSGKSLHEKIGISSTSGSEAQHPSGATPYDEHVDEECLFQNGDWEAVTERLCILEAQGKELNARQLALRAFSLSKLDYLDECRNYAMTSIEKDPTEPLAYCTMAAGASRKELFHDARLWLSLAHATGKTDKEPEFEREGKAIRYAAATYNILLDKLAQYFANDSGLEKLRTLYPRSAESELFLTGVKAVVENSADFSKILATNHALASFVSQVKEDPAPEILSEAQEDDQSNASSGTQGLGLAHLPQSVINQIGSFLSVDSLAHLRQTSGDMKNRWNHWILWRAQLLSTYTSELTSSGRKRPVIDIGCYPLSPHEWEPFYRQLRFVLASWKIAKISCDARDSGAVSHWTGFSSELNQKLRDLAISHRIYAANDYEEPFNDALKSFISLLCIDKGPLVTTLVNNISPSHVLMTRLLINPRSRVASSSTLATAMISLRKPLISLDLRKNCYFQASEILASMGEDCAIAARCSIAFADKLGHGFQLVPIWLSASRPSSIISKPVQTPHIPSSSKMAGVGGAVDELQSVSSQGPVERPIGGIYGKSDCSGVYRLFYRYSNPELEDEYDRGFVDLKFDPETRRVNGEGFDSLRGKSNLLDGRSHVSRSRAAEEATICDGEIIDGQSPVLRSLSVVLQYEDNTQVELNGSMFPYGYAGRMSLAKSPSSASTHGDFSHLSDKSSSFGHWIMIYDHATSTSKGEDREYELEELQEEAFDQLETADRLRFGFPLTPYRRFNACPFEPWHADIPDQAYLNSVTRMRHFSMLFQQTHSHGFDARIFRSLSSFEVVSSDDPSVVVARQTLRGVSGGRETQAKYESRCLAWRSVYLEYHRAILEFAVQYASDRFDRAIQRFEFGSPQEVFDEKCYWAQLLCLCTEFSICEPQELLLLLRGAQRLQAVRLVERETQLASEQQARATAEARLTVSNTSDSAFFNALENINQGRSSDSEAWQDIIGKNAGKNKSSKANMTVSPTTLVVGILVTALAAGIGAFFVGRVMSQSQKGRKK